MTTSVIEGVNFNASEVSYGKPKLNASGGKSIPVVGPTKKALMLSTPLMITWGANENDFDGSGKKTYDMSIQFPSDEYPNPDASAFLENMKELEAKLKADAVLNSKDWFNKAKMSGEVVDALFTPMLKYPKDKATGEPDYTRAPTLRVKLPYWEGVFKNIEIYDIEENQIYPDASQPDLTPYELIQSGSHVGLLIQCGGLWFANGKFGVTWKLFQCILKPRTSLRGKCHIRLNAEDKARMVSSAAKSDEADAPHDQGASHVVVEDSDDEESQSAHESAPEPVPEPVPEPEPAPVVKKKKVVKKKQIAVDAAED